MNRPPTRPLPADDMPDPMEGDFLTDVAGLRCAATSCVFNEEGECSLAPSLIEIDEDARCAAFAPAGASEDGAPPIAAPVPGQRSPMPPPDALAPVAASPAPPRRRVPPPPRG